MRNFTVSSRTVIILASVLLSACSSFWEKDNTPPPAPLAQFTPEIKPHTLWENRVGAGVGNEYLKLGPVLASDQVITSDTFGTLTSVDKYTGRTLWKKYINASVSSGPAVGSNVIVLGTKNGEVLAFSLEDRRPLWKTSVDSEILASPAITDNKVLVKSIDGKLTAFSLIDGRPLWNFQVTEPNLILRGSSTPQIARGDAIVGFANGKIDKISLRNGGEIWSRPVAQSEGAFAVQRMVDIDADPVIAQNHVYAATYQGKITAFNFDNGNELWTQDTSSYAGIAVDESRVYVSDATSHVWAFNRHTGHLDWKQTQLNARGITGPAVVGNYLVVGDSEGYLHWINKQTGQFAARNQVGGTAIIANPVAQNNVVYAITKDGYLAAYTMNSK